MEPQMPVLAQHELDHVASLILQMNSPEALSNPEVPKEIQKHLLELQKSDQAWGLTEGLMRHESAVVRFFGAQNAQIKMSRDWDTLPPNLQPVLLNQILSLTSTTASPSSPYFSQNGIVLRKLFSALASLILRLSPDNFPSPILTVLTLLAGQGIKKVVLLEWLTVVIKDVGRGALVEPRKSQVARTINEESSIVMRTILDALNEGQSPSSTAQEAEEKEKVVEMALECLEAWVEWGLSAEELTELLPTVYALLGSSYLPKTLGVIIEILTVSLYKDGKGTKILTEPLLDWLGGDGGRILDECVASGEADSEVILALTRFIDAMVEHSIYWMTERLSEPRVQNFLRVLLSLTGFPGLAGSEEEISEQTLVHYSMIQETMMEAQALQEDHNTSPAWAIAKHFFQEAVGRLKSKISWPDDDQIGQMGKDEKEKFEVYRRDAGEVMVTAFYVMRDDMLKSLVELLVSQLGSVTRWQDLEATIHCIRYTSEAVPLAEETYLPIVFSPQVFDKLPPNSRHEVLASMLLLIQSYEEWFKFHPTSVTFVLNYVVTALDSPGLAPIAARVLKSLCDLCRNELKQHVGAFAVLHGKVGSMQPEEQVKVIEAITSVLQALPPQAGVEPVVAIIGPIVTKLEQCIAAAPRAPEAARAIALQQIDSLRACAEGLTAPEEDIFDPEPEETANMAALIFAARQDTALAAIRDRIANGLTQMLDIWPTDAEVDNVLSSFIKAVASSHTSHTLISLPAAALLHLVGTAAQRSSSAAWPNLASYLVFHAGPTPILARRKLSSQEQAKEQAVDEAAAQTVTFVAQVISQSTVNVLSSPAAMQEHPDVAEAFFKFGSAVVSKFPASFLAVPQSFQAIYMQIAIAALTVQERFTLKGGVELLVGILHTSRHAPSVADGFLPLIQAHVRNVLAGLISGAAVICPRSNIPNHAELLVALITRIPNETREVVVQLLAESSFPGGQATAPSKKKFEETILRSRTPKKMREALNDFALICRGLADTTYGGATAS